MTARSLHSISAEPICNHPVTLLFLRYSLGRRRVCQVELHGDKTFTLKQQKYRVSEALKTGEATVLFGARPSIPIIALDESKIEAPVIQILYSILPHCHVYHYQLYALSNRMPNITH